METGKPCINTSCEFHDEEAFENCAGECGGEPAIASCSKSQDVTPPETLASLRADLAAITAERDALRSENANLRAATRGQTFYHSDEAVNNEIGRLRGELERVKGELTYYRDTVLRNLLADARREGQEEMLARVKTAMEDADQAHEEYDESWFHLENAICTLEETP